MAEVPGSANQILTHHADSAILGGSVFNHTELLTPFYPDPEHFHLKPSTFPVPVVKAQGHGPHIKQQFTQTSVALCKSDTV